MPNANELAIDTSADALTLATTIFGDGVTVESATLTGAAGASATYTGADATLGGAGPSDSGIILSTGLAADFTNSSGTIDTNVTAGTSTDNLQAGDTLLDAETGQTTFDAVILEAVFTPEGDFITMLFTFSSEEYLEYVNGGVNDAFGVWVNNAFVPFNPAPNDIVSIDTINNVAASNLYVDNPATTDPFNTEMDGFTQTLSIVAPVNPDVENTIRIALADGGDSEFDTNVLIAADSVQTVVVAFDDAVNVEANTATTVDVLANDIDNVGLGLTITEINGVPIVVGQTVTLPTGEQVTLNADNTITVLSDGDLGSEPFAYTVEDAAGDTSVAFITVTTEADIPLNYIVEGTSGDDTINTSYTLDPQGDRIDASDALDGSNNDSIEAGAGNDSINSELGNDTIDAGTGNDSVSAGLGDDSVIAGVGNDTVFGQGGNDTLLGGEGADSLDGDDGSDNIDGGSGNDTLIGDAGNDTLLGGAGNDEIYVSTGNNLIDGGANNDLVFGGDLADTITGGTEMDSLYGNAGSDSIDGGADADLVSGGSGNDTLSGGTGDDTVSGGLDADSIDGGDGADVLNGDDGNDTVVGGAGNDSVFGGVGDDSLSGGIGNDSMEAWVGNDTLDGGEGDDYLDGADGNDLLLGGDGNDTLLAGNGGGQDTLIGGAGNDMLSSGDGNDTMSGGIGDDTYLGAGGDDLNIIENGFGNDAISGGETGETTGDTLDLSAVTDALTIDLTASNPEAGTFTDGTDTATFNEIENIILGAGIDTLVLADDSGNDVVGGFTAPTVDGSGNWTAVDVLDVTALTDANGAPVNTDDVTVSDTNGDGTGDAILIFPGGETLTLTGVPASTFTDPAALEAIGVPLPNYIVEGDETANLIDANYIDDPEGDMVDANDNATATNDDLILAGGGDDTVVAGLGNDTIFGGSGNDNIDGGSDDDVISGGMVTPTILNGDFSSGTANWTGGAQGIEVGQENLYLANGSTNLVAEINVSPAEKSTLEQDFAVSEAGTATLSFDGALRIDGELGLDGYEVEVLDSSGNVVGSMTVIPTAIGTWETYTLDVNFPDADTYTLRFTEIGGTDGAGALLDNVEFLPAADADTLYGGGGDDTIYGNDGDDLIYAGEGTDVAFGGDGNDYLGGGDGNDSLVGGAGNDDFDGDGGNDTIEGGLGNDNMDGGTGADSLSGGDGNDSIWGGGNDDTIDGGAGNDAIYGGTGNDSIDAGAGTDYVQLTSGNDTVSSGDDSDNIDLIAGAYVDGATVNVDGGAGGVDNDTLDLDSWSFYTNLVQTTDPDTNSTSGTVELQDAAGNWITVTFTEIENILLPAPLPNYIVEGTTGDDVISAAYLGDPEGDRIDNNDALNGSNDDSVEAGAGNDSIFSGSGNDTVNAGTGNDTVNADSGDDVVNAGDGNDTVRAGSGDDTVFGEAGNDLIFGFDGNDSILAGDGSDIINGMTGNDLLDGGADNDTFVTEDGFGADTIVGGEGVTTGTDFDVIRVSSSSVTDPVTVLFSADEAGSLSDGTDTLSFSEIEEIQLADNNDTVDGTVTTNGISIDARGGDDSVLGGSGDDSVQGGTGDDLISGNAGNDLLDGEIGNDTLAGGTGADTIDGAEGDDVIVLEDGFGNDSLDGGQTTEIAGDTLDLSATTTGVTVDLTDANPENGTVSDGTDTATFLDMENIVLGGGNDTVTLADGSGDDIIQAFDLTDSGDGTTNDQLDVSSLTSDGGTTPVNTDDVVVTDTNGDGTGDAILTFPGGESITLVGVLASQVDSPAELVAIGIPSNGAVDGTLGSDSMDVGFTDVEGDIIDGADGINDTIFGYDGNDTVVAGAGDDTVFGGADNDVLDGGSGSDFVYGEAGDDTILSNLSTGADFYDGGTGTDTFLIGGTVTDGFGYTIDLTTGLGSYGNTYLNFENVTGGSLADSFTGTSGANVLIGNAGNDTLIGGAGDDTLSGGDDADSVDGGTGADSMDGGSGNDTITFAEGDTASGGTGDDLFVLADLGEPTNGTITIVGGQGGETPDDSNSATLEGDTLQLSGLADRTTLVQTSDGINADGNESFSGSITLNDGTILNFSEIENIICFTPGTRISTPHGARDIATLKVGDLVVTRDHGLQPIRWIQSRTVPAVDRFGPIRIKPGVITGQERDLLVSPQHRMLFQGYRAELLFGESEVLAAASHLIDGKLVTQETGGIVTYIHMMFDEHEVVYAEGAATESFHPGESSLSALSDPAREELFALFPELRSNIGSYGQTARRCLRNHEAKVLCVPIAA